MPAKTPDEVNKLLIESINNGDVDSALALYEESAAFVTAEGTAIGHDAIRGVLEAFVATKPNLTMEPKETVATGDVAITRGVWNLDGTGPDGEPIKMSGRSMEVVRRQADGNWLFAIDHPNGAD